MVWVSPGMFETKVMVAPNSPIALAKPSTMPASTPGNASGSVTFSSAEESLLLEVSEGTPLVCIRCRMRTEAGESIEVTRELYRSDRFEFSYSAEAGAWTPSLP